MYMLYILLLVANRVETKSYKTKQYTFGDKRFMRPSQRFAGFREKGYLYSGIWGKGFLFSGIWGESITFGGFWEKGAGG